MKIPDSVLEWLLEPIDPSMRYRTLTELLDTPLSAQEVAREYELINDSSAVNNISHKMHPDGYWLRKKSGTNQWVGAGVEYMSASTTHYCLAYLSELGLTKEHPIIKKASDRYLGLQAPDGDWFWHLSCLQGYNIKTFLRFGYREDARLNKSVSLLIESSRFDGGYLCDMHEKRPGSKRPKSCVRGSTKALEAFAELGEDYWNLSACQNLCDYFLNRNGIFTMRDKTRFVNNDVICLFFPFIYYTGLLQILYSLSKMGYGNDNRLDAAWNLLEKKKFENGRYPLERTPTQSPWKVGEVGQENKWITFYAYLAKKYRDNNEKIII
jgi:hypothetical protein